MTVTNRHVRRGEILLLAIGVAAISFLLTRRVLLAQDRVAFTAKRRETAYRPSGEVGSAFNVVFGVRSDGSTVRVQALVEPEPVRDTSWRPGVSQRLIRDLRIAEQVSVDGLTESITTVPLN